MVVGAVVRILSGRDKGKLMMVTGNADGRFFVADGKRRKLESPKSKNLKHIEATDIIIDVALVTGNKKLVKLLRDIGDKVSD